MPCDASHSRAGSGTTQLRWLVASGPQWPEGGPQKPFGQNTGRSSGQGAVTAAPAAGLQSRLQPPPRPGNLCGLVRLCGMCAMAGAHAWSHPLSNRLLWPYWRARARQFFAYERRLMKTKCSYSAWRVHFATSIPSFMATAWEGTFSGRIRAITRFQPNILTA